MAGKVTAGVAVLGGGGVLQIFAATSGKVKVGTNGWRGDDYVRTIDRFTWDSMSASQKSAWSQQTAEMCYASMTKPDVEESGAPSEFATLVPPTPSIQATGESTQTTNSIFSYNYKGPMTGSYREKIHIV